MLDPMAYDVWGARGLFPSLGDGWIHLDAQAGMQVPDAVAGTVAAALRSSVSDPAGPYPSARRGAGIVEAARAAMADMVGADPAGVVLGPDRYTLLMRLARASRRRLGIGTDVVLSRLDDEAAVVPWLEAADLYGSAVKWAEIDNEAHDLPEWQYADLIGETTGVVSVTAASSRLGVMPRVREITDRARTVGALSVVDVHSLAPYRPVDITALGADVVTLDCAGWGGPQIGALVVRDPGLLGALPSLSPDPAAAGPARLESTPHQFALLAGVVSSVETLAGLVPGEAGDRRTRLVAAKGRLADYHRGLTEDLVAALRTLPLVMVLGAAAEDTVPMLSFTVAGVSADRVVQRLAENGICALATRYGSRALETIGVLEIGGAVTIGLGPYTTGPEIDQLIRVIASLG